MTFEELLLDERLLASLARMKHEKPTSIQQQTLPLAMEQRDILAHSPTGTGKTAAFILPTLQHLLDYPRRRKGFARALVLTPTRELAVQIHQYTSHLAYGTDLNIAVITGGQDYQKQKQILANNMDVLIATPGRLIEYLKQDQFELDALEILIIDEADRMLDMGFRKEVKDMATAALGRQQTMLFSATLDSNGGVQAFSEEILDDPVVVEAMPSRKEHAKIHQWLHLADSFEHKVKLLTHLLQQDDVTQSIVFVKTRERVAQLEGLLQSQGIQAAFLRGDMEQKERFRALSRLVKKEVNVLIATDVAARGLDVKDISHVFNFDLPRKADTYVHRIGRTGRAGAKGCAISLVEAHDMGVVAKIERFISQKLKRRAIEGLRPQNKEAKAPSKHKAKSKLKNKAKAKPSRKKTKKK
jgi:ATP-dependent RNA helicase SrmB